MIIFVTYMNTILLEPKYQALLLWNIYFYLYLIKT